MKKLTASMITLAGLALLLQGCSDAGGFQDGGPHEDGGPAVDGGPDAGVDAGGDAGPDGGADAGPPLFGTPILSTIPFGAAQMAAADFNGDGKQDLVVSLGFPYFDGAGVELMLGNGDGTFQAPVDFPTGADPRGIVVLDMDGDGRPDFAVGACADGGSYLSFFRNGDGGFAPRVDVPISSCPLSLAVADLNGDGRPDLVTAGPGSIFGAGPPWTFSAGQDGGLGEIHLLLNQGGGLFAVSQTLTTDAPADGIAAADLNGDHVPDLAVITNSVTDAGAVDARLLVWLGADGGALQALPPLSLDQGGYVAITAGDLDGDGHPDLALVSNNSETLALLLGKGDGTFQSPTFQGASGNPVAVAIGDLQKKGILDVASSSSNAYFQGLSVFPGGAAPPAPPLGAQERILTDGASYGLAIADFTGDGRPDIAVSLTYRNAVAVMPGLATPPVLPDPATFTIAQHLAIPVVPYQGGPIIGNPEMITLTYQDEPNTSLIHEYAGWIVDSSWLSTIGGPYGIGLGTNANFVIAQNAPAAIQDSEIQSLISDLILDGGVPPPLVADGGIIPQQIYFVYFPNSTTITASGAGTSCNNFGGYHGETQVGTVHFAYAVIPTCDPSAFRQESAVSHELAEASTDPLVNTRPAYSSGQTLNSGLLGEVGDVCTGYETFYALDGGTFVEAQRIWSNPRAIANSQPCIPAPGGVYANLSPKQTGSSGENIFGIAAGGSLEITVTGWTNAPSVPFGIVPLPYPKYGLLPVNMYPDVSISSWNLANGEQAVLTVKVPADAASQAFGMVTLLSGFDEQNYGYWPLIIFVP
jgi:FG-GAP-like repeat/FG-GAP repeat